MAINVLLRGGSSSVIASVYSVSLPHVPCPTAGCLSIPRLGQLHHIFRFIMSNHFENLSFSSYILHKLLCLSFESLSVFCFKMSSNVVNFPSEYLVRLQPDIWKTLLQGTSQIKINLSGCSMITKSFQKFGESSLKTVLWPPAIKLEFQPMCSLRPICICIPDLQSLSDLLFFCIRNEHFLKSSFCPVVKTTIKVKKQIHMDIICFGKFLRVFKN